MKTETTFCVAAAAVCALAFALTSTSHNINRSVGDKDDEMEANAMVVMREPTARNIIEELVMEEVDDTTDVDPFTMWEDTPVNWFSDEYLELNRALKDYADTYATINFHGTEIDGLAVMAQANCESAYMCDASKTLSALYPSIFVDIDDVDDIAELDITKVWEDVSALNGTYISKPYWSEKAGPYYAWSTGDGTYEQGPLQQRVTPASVRALGSSKSEVDKLKDAGLLAKCKDTLYGYEATSLVTGTEYLDYCLGYETTGDRWSVKDNCVIWKTDKEATLNRLWNSYYSTCGYTPNKYELLSILAYAHWIPSVIAGDTALETINYYGFSYDGAWFELAHQLSSESSIAIIRSHVRRNIDKNRQLFYDGTHSKEEAMQVFALALNAGSTTTASDSEPWTIFNELVDAGCVNPSTIIVHPEYGYQHAMKYAIQYLYSYEMLNMLLLEGY